MNPIILPTSAPPEGTGLTPFLLLAVVLGYFLMLLAVAYWSGRGTASKNDSFYKADGRSPWYLIAFGTIGGSLSGVTFVSVPGAVGTSGANTQFSYWQIVLGYIVGYWIIAGVLMPIYYKYNLTSIYGYLQTRFGLQTYRTGASFFLISRTIGTAFRLFITSIVLQTFIFDAWGVPFWATVLIILLLIWIYTNQGGIKTIVWTDAVQTAFMFVSVFGSVYLLMRALSLDLGSLWAGIERANLGKIFFFDNGWADPNNFFKQFLSGIFIAIVMTGLDQDMMQKNLTCKSLWDAQKNMIAFSVAVLIMNFVFLILGALLWMFWMQNGTGEVPPDRLFPTIALEHFPLWGSIIFIIGLTAAAYASTDSALTALTTSFCIDILGFKPADTTHSVEEKNSSVKILDDIRLVQTAAAVREDATARQQTFWRRLVHVGFAALVFVLILAFWFIDNRSVINSLLTISGYTYGPLLGLFAFGVFTQTPIHDRFAPLVCIAAPVLTFLINYYSDVLLWGYKFSFELLLLNGLLTFLGLWALRRRASVA